MTKLLTNRYDQVTPTSIQQNGCSVSTPIYFTPTADQNKALLNAFREVVRKQRLEMGFPAPETSSIGVTVVTHQVPPLTPAEQDLGMNEESLRYALFQRRGTPERLIIKLQQITGLEFIKRKEIEETFFAWLDELGLKNENKRPKRTNKTSKSTPSSSPAS